MEAWVKRLLDHLYGGAFEISEGCSPTNFSAVGTVRDEQRYRFSVDVVEVTDFFDVKPTSKKVIEAQIHAAYRAISLIPAPEGFEKVILFNVASTRVDDAELEKILLQIMLCRMIDCNWSTLREAWAYYGEDSDGNPRTEYFT
jgi:hypothetical protein